MSVIARSTSTMTQRIARAIRVAARRPYLNKHVDYVGVFNCRTVANSSSISSHAFGDAGDLMLKPEYVGNLEVLEKIAKRIIADASGPTWANRGRKTRIVHVIYGGKEYVAGRGVRAYAGTPHLNHIHMSASFSMPASKPPLCSGGTNFDVPYLFGSRGYTQPIP